MSLLLLLKPASDLTCDIYFDLDCTFSLGDDISPVTIKGKDVVWNYLRRQGTIEKPTFNKQLNVLNIQASWYEAFDSSIQLNYLRTQITFYRDYVMANQDPFIISKGGKLVTQRIFLNPLRVAGDEISGTPTTTQSETGFTVDNIEVNSTALVNEDGITFPIGTVISFDCLAPGSLGVELDYDEAIIYFNFITVAGLQLRISHPIRVVDAIEVR